MESVTEEQFVVFVRTAPSAAELPQPAEEPLLVCSSYAEAQRFRRAYEGSPRDCVIRYVGPAGGGD